VGTATPAGGVTVTALGNTVRVNALTTPGTYSVSYIVADADALTAFGTITIVVTLPPNNPPLAVADSYSVLAIRSTFPVLDNDFDVDGGALTLATVTAPTPAAAGATSIAANQVVFDPTDGFTGTVSFNYTVRDPQGASAVGIATVLVTACPAVPPTPSLSVITRLDTPATFNIFAGAGTAPAGTTTTITQPAVGTATLNTAGTAITYVPPAGTSVVTTMGYSLRTTCGGLATGVINITVNRAPTAMDDTISSLRGQTITVPVLANDLDPDGDALRVVTVTGACASGQPHLTAGVVTFVTSATAVDPCTFGYQIVDPGGLTANASVTVTITNVAPIAVPDSASTVRGNPLTSSVILNDTDVNGDVLALSGTPTIASPASGAGSVVRSGNTIVYTPGTFIGTVVVNYVVTDGALTDTGTLSIDVANHPPAAVADAGSIDLASNSPVTVNVLANDSDPDGASGSLTLSGATLLSPSQGTVTISGGSITFTPSSALSAPASVVISYTIVDADGGTASSTLTITVTDTTPPPTTIPPTTIPPTLPPPPTT
jgi:hypothetical protein